VLSEMLWADFAAHTEAHYKVKVIAAFRKPVLRCVGTKLQGVDGGLLCHPLFGACDDPVHGPRTLRFRCRARMVRAGPLCCWSVPPAAHTSKTCSHQFSHRRTTLYQDSS